MLEIVVIGKLTETPSCRVAINETVTNLGGGNFLVTPMTLTFLLGVLAHAQVEGHGSG